MAKLPHNQRCQFLLGPASCWFMQSTTDVWTQPSKKTNVIDKSIQDVSGMDYEENDSHSSTNLSYFIYGSTGCFCYGQIHHNPTEGDYDSNGNNPYVSRQQHFNRTQPLAATLNRLIDIKDDNSRVVCTRFLKNSSWPLAMILTENGSLIIHDCLSSKNLIHFRKAEMIQKFIDPLGFRESASDGEPGKKRPKFDITQQINSCLWANSTNAFLGFSLIKENINLLFWLKMKDLAKIQEQVITKSDLIESCQNVNLDLAQYSRPICCMELTMLNNKTCLIAIATDDGLITVVSVDLDKQTQNQRVIKLKTHTSQICSMSFSTENLDKFPLGLLAAVSRESLTSVWNLNIPFNFGEYRTGSGKDSQKVNWFSLSFIQSKHNPKRVNLALSNIDSGLTILEIPENAHQKQKIMTLKAQKQGASGSQNDQTLRHHALIMNLSYDSVTEVLMTSSLDSNHLFWRIGYKQIDNNPRNPNNPDLIMELKPQYLYPAMPNNSRTHMIRFSPIKEELVALALGKAGLRFHYISNNPLNHRFDMSPSCTFISRKITKASLSPTSVAWHPSNEYRIAIGTLEGKVLRADLTPRRAKLIEAEHREIIPFEPNESPTDDLFGVSYTPLEHREPEIGGAGRREPTNNNNNGSRSKNPPKTDGVYSMCWGPNPTCPEDLSRLVIYAVGSISHRLYIYYKREETSDKMSNFLDDFSDKSLPEAVGNSSEVAWKSDFSLMALGTNTGKIIILNYPQKRSESNKTRLFDRLAEIEGPLGGSYIQCLAWHPTADKENSYYYCLAASANDAPGFVFNVREYVLVSEVRKKLTIEDDGDQNILSSENEVKNILSKYIHKLEGHNKTISDMAWNPHRMNEIATSSFDRQCHVWKLLNPKEETNDNGSDSDQVPAAATNAVVISTFTARNRLFTMEWSLVDEDLIFTSGHDSTVWVWRPTENPNVAIK